MGGALTKSGIGVSIRTTKNSYFEFKLGYNISSNVKTKKVADFENDVYASTPSKNMSYGFFSIGFTPDFITFLRHHIAQIENQ